MQSRRDTFLCAALLATAISLAACADAPNAPFADGEASNSAASSAPALERRNGDESRNRPGAVYTLTNATGGNGVVAFHRAANGSLTPLGTFATGGNGVGGTLDPLTSQFAVVLNENHDALFAVDAGSDDITSFKVGSDGALTLASRVSSGGTRPNSISVAQPKTICTSRPSWRPMKAMSGARIATLGYRQPACHSTVLASIAMPRRGGMPLAFPLLA